MAREVLEHGLHPGGVEPPGKRRAVLAGLGWIGGKGAVPHHLEVAAVHVQDRGEVHRQAVGSQALANLAGQGLDLLRALLRGHGLRGGIIPQHLGEALHPAALEVDGGLEIAAYLLPQGVEAAGAFAQQLRVGPAGDEQPANAGLEFRLRIVVVERRRHEQGGGLGAHVLLLGRGAGRRRAARRLRGRRAFRRHRGRRRASFTRRFLARTCGKRADHGEDWDEAGFSHTHQCA